VNPAFVQRQAVLAAGALLATLSVLALDRGEEEPSVPHPQVSLRWERALVGVLPARGYARQTTCGVRLESGTLGVSHPLLPCGVDLIVAGDDREIRTEVVERAAVGAGREFELTRALASELGLEREATIRWRFAE
jgi:hypothetical protein